VLASTATVRRKPPPDGGGATKSADGSRVVAVKRRNLRVTTDETRRNQHLIRPRRSNVTGGQSAASWMVRSRTKKATATGTRAGLLCPDSVGGARIPNWL